MLKMNILHFFLVVFVISGCKIQVEAPANGVVTTQSGSFSCGAGEVCTIEVADIFFKEIFVAVPDAGFTFVQWKRRGYALCAGTNGKCPVDSSVAEGNEILMAILESETTYYLEPDFGMSDTWEGKTELPIKASAMATCAIRGKFYAVGVGAGHTAQGEAETAETRVEVYDPATGTWTRLADMPTGRRWGSAAAVNNKCYVMGGGATGGTKSVVEEYSPLTDTWREMAPMPTPRSTHVSVALNGKIYVIGGGERASWRQAGTAQVAIFDPKKNAWSSGADMPEPRGGVAAGAMDGYIYVIGGSNPQIPNSDLVHRYHPESDSWQQMTNFPVNVDFATATVLNGSLYVIGGLEQSDSPLPRASDEATDSVYRYNPKADRWRRVADMTQRRLAAGSEAVDGRIVVVGGREQRDCCGSLSSVEAYTP